MDDHGATSFSTPIDLRRLASARASSGVAAARLGAQAGAMYIVAVLVSLAVTTALGARANLPAAVKSSLVAALVLTVVMVGRSADMRRAMRLWVGVLTLLAAGCLYQLAHDGLPNRPYGDGAQFSNFVTAGRPVPRWLVGSAAAVAVHAAVWELPPVRARLPEPLRSPTAFLSVLGSAAMVGGTWGLFRRWPGRLSVLLPALTPVWLLFASGYVEYYPLIAVPFVAALAWLFERPLQEREAHEIGAVTALLALVYVGFVPTAGLLLATWVALRPAAAFRAVGVAVVVGAALIALCWPEGAASYFRTLYPVLNFGDAHLPARYAGQIAGPASILFASDAVQSSTRMREVSYMLAWGGGWWTTPLVVVAAYRAWQFDRSSWRGRMRDGRVCLGLGLIAWHLYYIVFMVPRLGPTGDVDLFFPTYLTLAFMAGLLLDSVRRASSATWTACTLACVLAALAVSAPWLVWLGLPSLP